MSDVDEADWPLLPTGIAVSIVVLAIWWARVANFHLGANATGLVAAGRRFPAVAGAMLMGRNSLKALPIAGEVLQATWRERFWLFPALMVAEVSVVAAFWGLRRLQDSMDAKTRRWKGRDVPRKVGKRK